MLFSNSLFTPSTPSLWHFLPVGSKFKMLSGVKLTKVALTLALHVYYEPGIFIQPFWLRAPLSSQFS